MTLALKVFRDGVVPRTLYHSLHGSTKLAVDKLLRAKQGVVTNPGKKTTSARRFRAGFHCFTDEAALARYTKNMDPDYVVTQVVMNGKLRRKPGSNGVMLASQMFISNEAWQHRSKLRDFLSRRLT